MESARLKYQVAIDEHISEGNILWNRYNAILVFNTILITAIGLSYQDGVSLPPLVKIFLPIAGLVVCYIWFIVTLRGFQWIEFWITKARKIEEEYLVKNKGKISDLDPISKGNENRAMIVGWPKTAGGAYILIILVSFLYVVFLFYAINSSIPVEIFRYDSQK